MAPLPLSLSPHICILCSEDLDELLSASSLPQLSHILQSFSPLSQVTTRTTSLVSVNHSSFNLRFSDLGEIERACQEDEDQRAIRNIDWIGARIHKRCNQWIEDIEKSGDKGDLKSPWWEEFRRCVEGDHVPSRIEAWNHPAAVIFAVSTASSNPLQVITALHSRPLDLPPWVDRNILRYTLIVHPSHSGLSDEEAGALFNAVKKQYGLHSFLLAVNLPQPPPPPVPVPALLPRLPQARPESTEIESSPADFPPSSQELNTIRLSQPDIQQIARFTREFLVMSLLPWMEKCVLEWNEAFTSNRRLPSRLFSSTRRLFGSATPSPIPMHNVSSSISSISRSSSVSTVDGSPILGTAPPSQQRRLAEFATILGDHKLATSVWEALRKESKGGSDILPLLLAPSPTQALHASTSLALLNSQSEPLAFEQLSALKFAVRWETGIPALDFISYPLEGERWLVQAAGNSEEPTSALLVAHAAWLSTKKNARRRAAFWYFSASHKLEKSGIKPLTMYFLRQSRAMFEAPIERQLSPSFWETEGKFPDASDGLNGILAGIEHPLGRLLYTSGDVTSAVRVFLELLRLYSRGSALPLPSAQTEVGDQDITFGAERVFLEDFRMALSHFKEHTADQATISDLRLPFELCHKTKTQIRLPGPLCVTGGPEWEELENIWKQCEKTHGGGKDAFTTVGKAAVDEAFWVDIVLVNPFNAEIDISNISLDILETKADAESCPQFVSAGVVEAIVLSPKETRQISIRVISSQPSHLTFVRLKYDFLSLLSTTESLAVRGQRLHATPAQRQNPTYAPDRQIQTEIVALDHKLVVDFIEDQPLVLAQGEVKALTLWFSNTGSRPIQELWGIVGCQDGTWMGEEGKEVILHSSNSLEVEGPQRIPIMSTTGGSVLSPGDNMEVQLLLHANSVGQQQLRILFVHREDETASFSSSRVARPYEVHPILEHSLTSRTSHSADNTHFIDLELTNLSAETIEVTQVASIGTSWRCVHVLDDRLGRVWPAQASRLVFGAQFIDSSAQQQVTDHVLQQVADIINGRQLQPLHPPPIELKIDYSREHDQALRGGTLSLYEQSKRHIVLRSLSRDHPDIHSSSYPRIFPLHKPSVVDFVVFWSLQSPKRSGFILVPGVRLGSAHGLLNEIIRDAEGAKVKRSMYAETEREKQSILESIRASDWNAEVPPLSVRMQEPATLTHVFDKGACHARATLTVCNQSSTHASRFSLNPLPRTNPSNISPMIPYIGQLSFRGILRPLQSRTFRVSLWITQAGSYDLGGWKLVTELLSSPSAVDQSPQVLSRYEQEIYGGKSGRLTVVSS